MAGSIGTAPDWQLLPLSRQYSSRKRVWESPQAGGQSSPAGNLDVTGRIRVKEKQNKKEREIERDRLLSSRRRRRLTSAASRMHPRSQLPAILLSYFIQLPSRETFSATVCFLFLWILVYCPRGPRPMVGNTALVATGAELGVCGHR